MISGVTTAVTTPIKKEPPSEMAALSLFSLLSNHEKFEQKGGLNYAAYAVSGSTSPGFKPTVFINQSSAGEAMKIEL